MNAEFIRFLRYAKRSCTEVRSELYVSLDEEYISPNEFKDVYEQARRTFTLLGDSDRACCRSWIHQLSKLAEDHRCEPVGIYSKNMKSAK